MSAWQAIQYVGSGLSLVAFIVAASLFAYRARLRHRAEIIRSAPAKDRLEAIAVTAQFFRVDTKKLSPKQQEDIILAQITSRARRDLILAVISVIVALLLAFIALAAIFRPQAQASYSNNPLFSKIVAGRPTEQCHTDPRGSPVQLFQKGWLVAALDLDIIFSIWKNPDGTVGWSRQSGTFSDDSVSCASIEGQHDLLQLGFRSTYCAANADGLRIALGLPLTSETRAWIQYQQTTEGLFLYGLPSKKAAIERENFEVLEAAFLTNEQRQFSGSGAAEQVTVDAREPDPYCTPIWYPAEKDLSIHPNQQKLASHCARMVLPREISQPRDVCSDHGF